MWYSSLSYQISPNEKLPVPHFASEKSSVTSGGRLTSELMLAPLLFGFVFVFVFRLTTREFVFVLLLLLVFELMLANTISMTTTPMAMTPTMTAPPAIHQIAPDFFRGTGPGTEAGAGAHCGGCDAGAGGREAGGCETGPGWLLAGGSDG